MIEPARLVEAQVTDAGRLLARAFIDDPGTAIVEPDPARRLEANRTLFELDIRSTLGAVWACLEAGTLAGVAIWQPPDASQDALDERSLSHARAIVGSPTMERWLAMLDEFERVRQVAIDEPHWFLALLGVDPAFQARGVGSTLMRIGHEAADMDGRPCFLETFTEPNVAYYERRGYAVTRSTTIADGVPIHAMMRQPRVPG
jgi:GNAT superfamily N-acetyltransferase